MTEVPIPFTDKDLEKDTLPVVRDYLQDGGQVRLSDLRHDLDDGHHGSIGPALVELVEDGEVALLPVGDEVVIRSEK